MLSDTSNAAGPNISAVKVKGNPGSIYFRHASFERIKLRRGGDMKIVSWRFHSWTLNFKLDRGKKFTYQVVDDGDEDGSQHAGHTTDTHAEATHHGGVEFRGHERQHHVRRRDAHLAHAVEHEGPSRACNSKQWGQNLLLQSIS